MRVTMPHPLGQGPDVISFDRIRSLPKFGQSEEFERWQRPFRILSIPSPSRRVSILPPRKPPLERSCPRSSKKATPPRFPSFSIKYPERLSLRKCIRLSVVQVEACSARWG